MSNHELITTTDAKPIKAWIRGVPLEDEARKQLVNAARMPFIHHHIAVMPDVHCGIGATVGSVIPTVGAIIPAAVGVDIGCGMMAVRTSLNARDLPDDHCGIGATVGSVIPTVGAIIPAAVGVDIGCGMMAVRTSLNARDLPDD